MRLELERSKVQQSHWLPYICMTTPSRSRWFQFGLRTIFVVVMLFGGLAGLIAWQRNRQSQRVQLLATPGVSFASHSWGDNLTLNDVQEIDVGPSVPEDVFEKIVRAFPRAAVRRGSGARLPYSLSTIPGS